MAERRSALLLGLWVGQAVAAPQVRVTLDAPAACPSRAWLVGRVDAMLGRAGVADDAPRTAAVAVRSVGSGLRATLALDGGLRVLSTPTQDCAALLDATALAIVVVLDPLLGLTLPAPPSVRSEAPVISPPAPPAPAPAPRPEPAPPPTPPPRAPAAQPPGPWTIRAAGHLALGQTPGPVTFGITVGVDRRFGVFGLGVEGRWDAPAADPARGGEVAADWLGGSALGCVHLLDVLGLCGVVSAGAQTVSGVGFVGSRSTTVPYLAVGGRGRIDLPITALVSLQGWGELAVPASRTRLRVAGDVVWESWPVAIAGGAGLGVRL